MMASFYYGFIPNLEDYNPDESSKRKASSDESDESEESEGSEDWTPTDK